MSLFFTPNLVLSWISIRCARFEARTVTERCASLISTTERSSHGGTDTNFKSGTRKWTGSMTFDPRSTFPRAPSWLIGGPSAKASHSKMFFAPISAGTAFSCLCSKTQAARGAKIRISICHWKLLSMRAELPRIERIREREEVDYVVLEVPVNIALRIFAPFEVSFALCRASRPDEIINARDA